MMIILETPVARTPVAPAPRRRTGRQGADRLARHLPALREALERQHAFRREQLAQLAAQGRPGAHHRSGVGAASALQEVHGLIGAGARRALADIEIALARMDAGAYGRCRACGTDIPLQLLTAIPATTLCLACQQPRDERNTVI
jgi:DnaK suppressor protein